MHHFSQLYYHCMLEYVHEIWRLKLHINQAKKLERIRFNLLLKSLQAFVVPCNFKIGILFFNGRFHIRLKIVNLMDVELNINISFQMKHIQRAECYLNACHLTEESAS